MADEFQATGIIGGNWWNMTSSLGPSPCSVALSSDHMGSYGWSTTTDEMMNMDIKQQTRSSTTSDDNDDDRSASGCDNSRGMGFQDSSLPMLGFGLSSSSPTNSDWNHQTSSLLTHGGGGGRSGGSYNSMIPDDMMNLRQPNYEQNDQIQTDWNLKHFEAISDDPTIISIPTTNSYNIYPSSIVESLFEPDDHEAQPQQSVFDNNYHSSANFRTTCSSDFSPSWPNSSPPNFIKPSTQRANHFPYSNSMPYAINNNVRASFIASQTTQFHNSSFEEKPNCVNLTNKRNNELHVSTTKKLPNEPAFKRSRIETPSPLPTFKVRKEKLGDRITALQQLVSPFGKTDTASVLHEAIEYIKILHDQVLSTPYMKNGSQNLQHPKTSSHKIKDSEGSKQDLRSRGLCLVPISSTYPVANETTPDFWTPTFGGTFR